MSIDKSGGFDGSILVVGGGISGLTTALEAAEVGYEVFLIEKSSSLGGRVSQLNQYFPKLCPPSCGLEINFRRIKDNPRIKVFTMTEVDKVEGAPGNYNVTLKIAPRYVNENCTCCGECAKVCNTEVENDFNFSMDKRKGAYLPSPMAFPMFYVMAPELKGTEDAEKCKNACQYDAIDFDMEEKNVEINVGSIVWATGWQPYDAKKIDNLGFGKYDNIVTNMMLERLSAPSGPTKGKIVRPSDNKEPQSIAFVQCAGSRDENHLPYCSYICCMASLKQTTYIREQYPDADIYVFYIDVRAPGNRYEKFYKKIKEDEKVHMIKGKVAEVIEDTDKNITVVAENTLTGEKIKQTVEMAVLATGMQPTASQFKIPADLKMNSDGFFINDFEKGGMFAAGCANKPLDVVSSNQNATGMALKAIQTLVRSQEEVLSMDKKYGVYICTGCGIGDNLDVEKLCEVPKDEGFDVKTHPFLCSEEGVKLIKEDIANGTNALSIAGCSRRVNYDVFGFQDCLVDRVSIREQVIWIMPRDKYPAPTEEQKDDEEFIDPLQTAAEDYLKMSIIKLKKITLPEPYKPDTFSKKILVIGGGITGISAALDAAKAGYQVTIVEKKDTLGGYAASMRKQIPYADPYENLSAPIISDKIKEVEANGNIEIKTGTIVARVAGQPGEFTVTFKKPDEKIEFDVPFPLPPEMKVDENGKEYDVDKLAEIYAEYNKGKKDILTLDPNGEKFGAVILAAGWRPAKLKGEKYAHLGIDNANVITNVQYEEIAAKGKIVRPSDGKEAKSVVFVQSPERGDDSDFEYAGAVTSLVALKQAKYLREDYSDGKAYIVYQHMRTPGLSENFYKSIQDDEGIFLTKGEINSVSPDGDGLIVEADDTLLGEKIKVKADLVVLAAGMVPATYDDPVINLAYRQGPKFRDNALFDEYADSNFICFPYETQRTGIYAAGGIRRSMTIEESTEDAAGAALKAIQCIESINRGVAVHPRSGDMTFPDFFFQRCTQCKRCTEECPFGALDDDAKGTPKPNPARCRRCGTCMGACPERIIGFADYNIDSIGSMVKSINVPSPDDYDEPPLRILGLVCENDAMPALDIAALNRLDISPLVRFIPVRCLGSVNVIWIKDALSVGIDGAFLLGCKHGDDYQCHFVKGSELAGIRMKKIGEALVSLALETERVTQFEIAIDEYHKLPDMINSFVEEIEELGENPFKGF